MKFKNIFKKEKTSSDSVSKIESLDKKQLAKVVGGDDTVPNPEDAARNKPRYIVKADGVIYD